MTPSEQNIAIADALDLGPYQKRNREGKPSENGQHLWYKDCQGGGAYIWEPIPDYTTDLNAMHAAESEVMGPHWDTYFSLLIETCWRDRGTMHPMQLSPAHATASQRAEAFLRTIGRWVEKK